MKRKTVTRYLLIGLAWAVAFAATAGLFALFANSAGTDESDWVKLTPVAFGECAVDKKLNSRESFCVTSADGVVRRVVDRSHQSSCSKYGCSKPWRDATGDRIRAAITGKQELVCDYSRILHAVDGCAAGKPVPVDTDPPIEPF